MLSYYLGFIARDDHHFSIRKKRTIRTPRLQDHSQPNSNDMTFAANQLADHGSTRTHLVWFLLYVAFVIYGSLVPLEFQPQSLGSAWEQFQNITMLQLGVESRADWVANGVLYVPVGFLAANLLIGSRRNGRPLLPLLLPLFLALAFSCILAVGVEFIQVFFPARTVSLNDILAECIGSVLGIILAVRFTDWFRALLFAHRKNPERIVGLALQAYLVTYIAYCLFPYDFLITAQEIQEKIHSSHWAWWLASDDDHPGRLWMLTELFIETLSTIPFGIVVARRAKAPADVRPTAAIAGACLGLFIEIAQFFIASGISQGLSIITRAIGCWLGAWLWQRRTAYPQERIAAQIRRLTLPLTLLYLFAIAALNGWLSHRWHGLNEALDALGQVHFLPFYYHYYTSETMALISLVSVFAQYAPIGLASWAHRQEPVAAALLAAMLATGLEISRLFIDGLHADPTNILIAATTGWLVANFVPLFFQSLRKEVAEAATKASVPLPTSSNAAHPDASRAGASQRRTSTPPHQDKDQPSLFALRPPTAMSLCALMIAAACSGIWLAGFPVQPVLIGLLLTVYAVIIWLQPILAVALIPAALPVFDLAPWSGRFYLDEFDILLLIGLTIGYVRVAPASTSRRYLHDALLTVCLALLAASYLISTLIALTPWQVPDLNSFSNYFSPFNSLRISRGVLWALLFAGLIRRLASHRQPVEKYFAWGMIFGLAATVAVIVWERLVFPGLLDFASEYRVTGPFSAIHTGGAYIECYLAVATPFLILLIFRSTRWTIRLFGIALLLATTYALMVTFSRNGYSAFALTCLIVLLASLAERTHRLKRLWLVLLLGGATVTVAIPIFEGNFAQKRMSQISNDFSIRKEHWKDALANRDPGWMTSIFGMGVGRYPEIHYWRSPEQDLTSSYRLGTEAGNTFLSIATGNPIYIEQLVDVEAKKHYLLRFDARSAAPEAKLGVSICEKSMLTTAECAFSNEFKIGGEPGQWMHFEQPVDARSLPTNPRYATRPVKLSLSNAGKTSVDVDNVQLLADGPHDLIKNGKFEYGMDHWFFTTENLLHWHTQSLPIGILFDQGWFGLLAFGLLIALSVTRAARNAWYGDLMAGAALAAMTGFLTVGILDTLLDEPRFLFLFVILTWFCNSEQPATKAAARHDR